MIRNPAVAGTFYPSNPDELRTLVDGMLGAAAATPAPARAVMVPHAGLLYSGACAAAVLARVVIPPTVILLGPNHFAAGRAGAAVWARGAFRTPLGDVPVAEPLVEQMVRTCHLVTHDPVAHHREHSIEVELPFLQRLAPGVAIMPILLAWDDWARCAALGRALADLVAAERSDVLLVASSDMTHHESAARAERRDRPALAALEALDGEELLAVCRRERVSMCGRAAAATVAEAARNLQAGSGEVVDYRHSGWVTGDDADVVAYAGVVIH